jgi:hypothetical protein
LQSFPGALKGKYKSTVLAGSLSVHITFDNVMRCLEILAMIGIIVYAIEFFPLVGALIGFSLYVYPENFK